MTVMHTLLALLFAAWSAVMFAIGYGASEMRAAPPPGLGIAVEYHDDERLDRPIDRRLLAKCE